MNNKGQVIFFLFMVVIIIFVLALSFTPVVTDFVTDARNTTNLDCSNTSISNFDRGTCLVADITPAYFLGILLGLAGLLLGAKVILG